MSQLGIDQVGEFGACTSPESAVAARGDREPRKLSYPRHYVWIAGLALLDVVLTSLVLSTGGHELNALARFAIEQAGVLGMIGVKVLTLGVIVAIWHRIGFVEAVGACPHSAYVAG